MVAAAAAGPGVEAASVSLTWNAPTTNADGTPLTDLAGYRIYLGTASPTCPGGSFHTVASPTTRPASGQTVSASVAALGVGTTYLVRVTAVDINGNESACSGSASGVARPDFSVTPSATTSFGGITAGSAVDRAFTVENTSSVSISVAASIGAPFSIVSGNSFSLAPGASQTVTVRFRPTTVGTFAGNVVFIAGGDSVSRGVSASATAGATATLSVTKSGTGAGTVTSSSAGIACGTDCTETVAAGTRVTLTSSAAAGSIFAGWSGACSGTATCAVTLNAATTVAATFNTSSTAPPGGPVASSLSPAGAAVGSAGLTLVVNGSRFVASSVVRWNGASRPTTFVSATKLRAAITAADLAAARSVPVTVVTPSPGGGTSGTLTFTVTAPTPPAVPGPLTVTRTTADTTGVTFTIAWGRVSGATSYRYAAAFNDGRATRQGKVTSRSFQLRMPYHVSGAAFDAHVCIQSVSATGQRSTDQSCRAMRVPARRIAPPASAPPPPPPTPTPDYGWGVG